MGLNLIEVVEEVQINGVVPGGLNSTFITLIPKRSNPKTFNDFLPISL